MFQVSTDQTDESGKERLEYGTPEFPAAFFYDGLDIVSVPWHWHEEFELAYMVRGSLQVHAGSISFDATQGDAYFINSSVLHAAEPLTKGAIQKTCVFNARLIAAKDSIIFQKYVLPLMGRDDLPGCVIRPDSPEKEQLICTIEEAWDAGATNAKHHEIAVRNGYTDALVWLLEEAPATAEEDASGKAHKEELRFRQMLSFMEAHLADAITLSDIAESAHISVSESLRCFRARTSSSPMQYVSEMRLSKSRELLAKTDLKVTEVAARCGYADPGYFARIFKKAQGMTPVQYRRKNSIGSQHMA
jgi:AraC-like DNA-binding protein/mannose-6-phosphate isomerase-like protein (cupin superfamily)